MKSYYYSISRNFFIIVFLLFITTLQLNAQAFTSVWNTNNPGTSANNQISIPTNPAFTNYNYTVDWGDGMTNTGVTGNITHTYANPGSYTVSISGTFPAIYFNNAGDARKIIEITSWGTIQWQSMENAFYGCANLNFDAIAAPDLSQVTSLKNMFRGAILFNGILNGWDVSNVTDISGMFWDCDIFNRPLDGWNTGNITDMSDTFNDARNFNEPLDNWNTGSVTTMARMFRSANDFNQNINSWNTAQVTDMSEMFSATDMNFPLNNWDVLQVTTMSRMFRSTPFNQPLDAWGVNNVTDMFEMFSGTPFNQDISSWEVGNVTNMAGMFERNYTFNQPINSWNVANVTNMRSMFAGINSSFTAFNQPLDMWDTSSVIDMSFMFRSSRFNQPIEAWDVSNVETTSFMFDRAIDFNQPLNGWVFQSILDMSAMFFRALTYDQPLNNWDVSTTTDMSGMFSDAPLFNQNLDSWDTSNVVDMRSMFRNATSFDQNLGVWNISSVTLMEDMLDDSGLSEANYNNTLIGWEAQTVNNNVILGAANLLYCDGRFAREDLIINSNWTINDDIVNCSFVFCTDIITPIDGDINVPSNFDLVWEATPNATGYRLTVTKDTGGTITTVLDDFNVGNVTSWDFAVDFAPGDIVTAQVVPFNAEGPAQNCITETYTIIESWVNSPAAFKLTYNTATTNVDSTPANQLKISRNAGFTYNYSIDWGDNQFDNNVTTDITHIYDTPGVYTISIIGDYPAHYFNFSNTDYIKLLTIDQWGTQQWQSMDQAFLKCENMTYNAMGVPDTPDLSQVENIRRMFFGCELFNSDINDWDVSNVTNMESTFTAAFEFNQPLDQWDVSNVTDMSGMFLVARAFNQPIGGWDVGNVTNMFRMFDANGSASAFNQPLNNWNVSNATNMGWMFRFTDNFNQPLDSWDVSNVINMESMFENADVFNGNISSWNVENVQNMARMFSNADAFNQNLNGWNVENVINMSSMFSNTNIFNQPLNDWNTLSCTDMSAMFAGTNAFNQPLNTWEVATVTNMAFMFSNSNAFNQDISNWNVSQVTTMAGMFRGAVVFNQPLAPWNVDSVVTMESMFENAQVFNQPIGGWDVSAVATMQSMFENAQLFDQPIGNWDTSSVTLMNSMFQDAQVFNQNINDWDVVNVTNFASMFERTQLFNTPLGDWETNEAQNMAAMFKDAAVFNQNIDTWNTSFVTSMDAMFQNALAYNQPMESWNTASVTTMRRMFSGASVFNQNINPWNTRAVITMQEMFEEASAFNSNLNNWRVSDVENMDRMFEDATSFNQFLDEWDLGQVSMNSMFNRASAYDQVLGAWDMSQVTNLSNMLDNSGMSRDSYDSTLIAWSEQQLPTGLTLGALNVPYCDAFEERAAIISDFGWNIVGDVLDCPLPDCTTLLSPLDGEIDVPVNTNLSWEPAQFARGYRLTVTSVPANANNVVNIQLVDQTSYNFSNNFNGGEVVTVTIVPYNDEGDATGCTSETFTIISNQTPTVPDCTALTNPIDGAVDVLVGTDLSWEPVSNADSYIISVGTTSGGTDILDNENVGNVTTFDLPNDLPENTLIFVTIIPTNDVGDAIGCTEESFTTEFIPVPPGCTNLTLPLDGAVGVAIDTNLTWDAVADATGYLLTVGTTPGGNEILNQEDVLNTTVYDFPVDLNENDTYYVIITPYNNVGDATGCTIESFTTGVSSSVVAVCTNFTAQLDALGAVTILPSDVDGGSSDPNGPFTLSLDLDTFTCANIGENNVTLSATDANNVSATCTAVVTVVDSIAPQANCQNITVQLDATGNATITTDQVDNDSTDNCAIASYALDINSFDCTNLGANTVTLTVTDASNNSDSCSATVTVVENDTPTAICQDITVSLDASGQVVISADQVNNGSFFGCDNTNVNVSLDINSLDCANLGENTVTLTADNNGETDSCTAIVTVIDSIAPQANCQNITVQLDATGNVTIAPNQLDNGSTDNCAITNYMLDISTFDCTNLGDNLVTLMVTDSSGNQSDCSAIVTVIENQTPTAICQDLTVTLDASGVATIIPEQVNNGSFYGCDNLNVGLSLDINTFDCTNIGANTVTLIVENNGEIATCTATVTVIDTVAPVANCQNITIQLDDTGNTTILAEQLNDNSTDNCEIASYSASITTFDCSTIGDNIVTLTVTDTSGNESSCTATVTVIEYDVPVAICQNITVALDASGVATIIPEQVNNGSFYGCNNPDVTLSIDNATFDCSNIGTNEVLLTVERNGVFDSCIATVTVVDTLAPVASCQDITIQLDATGNATISAADINNNSLDNCGIESVTIDVTNFTCGDIGDNIITLTVTDESGNSSSCQSAVTVQSAGIPTAVCQDATISLNATGTTIIDPLLIDGGSTDACGGTDIILSVSPPFLDCDDFGETEVTLTVTSLEGATSQCTAIITVEAPVVQPEAVCQNITVTLNAEGIGTITPNDIDGGSTALFCGGGLSIDIDTFTCEDAGSVIPVTLTATNTNGFTDSCTANVFVVDTLDPTISCPEETLIIASLAPFELPDFSETGDVIITDNCSTEIIYEQDPPQGTFVEEGETTINVTVTDPSGNSVSCSFDIFVDPSLSNTTEINTIATIDMYPNPTDGMVYLTNPNEIALEQVSLYDISGRLVKQWNISQVIDNYSFNLHDVASASYFLIVETVQSQRTFQIVKN